MEYWPTFESVLAEVEKVSVKVSPFSAACDGSGKGWVWCPIKTGGIIGCDRKGGLRNIERYGLGCGGVVRQIGWREGY